jgi:hypothetical protein
MNISPTIISSSAPPLNTTAINNEISQNVVKNVNMSPTRSVCVVCPLLFV